MNELEQEQRVDVAAIEKSLADLWRNEKQDGEHAVTRAALWNVVAHTSTSEHQVTASEVLGRASASVPQRTIIIRAEPWRDPQLSSWISANCHLVGGGKQVCSEEIAIMAGGDRIHRVPPIVNALLIPDMPVAVWWLGDLPNEHEEYVETLLQPADRMIVDSSSFDSPADLALVSRVAEQTTTAPADLNWVRLEEWRTATASVFDAPSMRNRLGAIRRVRVISGASGESYFGQSVEALLYAAWIAAQVKHSEDREVDYRIERRMQSNDVGRIALVEIMFEDGSSVSVTRDRDRGILIANVDGVISAVESVTRTLECDTDSLIIRQLKRPEGDRVYLKTLPIAAKLSKRIAA